MKKIILNHQIGPYILTLAFLQSIFWTFYYLFSSGSLGHILWWEYWKLISTADGHTHRTKQNPEHTQRLRATSRKYVHDIDFCKWKLRCPLPHRKFWCTSQHFKYKWLGRCFRLSTKEEMKYVSWFVFRRQNLRIQSLWKQTSQNS